MSEERVSVRLESDDFSCERVQVREVVGQERIGQLFSFDVVLVDLDPEGPRVEALAGALVALVFIVQGFERRRIHGMIAQATDLLDTETDYATFRIRIVPRAYRLTLVRTQDIFVDTSIPEVIFKKVALAGLANAIDLRLYPGAKEHYPTREFIVQYEESDLNFVARLAEHVGVSFFFDHEGGADKLVFTDHNDGFLSAEGPLRVRFQSRGEQRDVYRLELSARIIPAYYGVGDYNYETPLVDLSATCELADAYGGGVNEYGSNYKDPAEGQRFAQLRAEEHQAAARVFTGESDLCAISAGLRLSLEGHPRLGQCNLLVTEVEHRIRQTVLSTGGDEVDGHYKNVFKAVPAAVPYRPPRTTPRPRIHGVMSGIVEAAPGVTSEQPWIDDHGRYLVRVLFDTREPGEQRASLPIRMAQPHAGPNYGVHFPLRPGVEVLLAFIGGDPDRPVIVGAVPNAVTPAPVVDREAMYHRIRTSSGVLVEIDDGR